MTSHDECFDLAVVGASFAGLIAARTAAMRGLRVAVIEAKPDAGARVATTGILVKEAAEEIDIPHHLTRRVHGVRLYAPDLRFIDLFAPGYFFLTTDTASLLRWLSAEAQRAGVAFFYSSPFRGAERQNGRFLFSNPRFYARYILGADGSRSAVARHFGLGINRKFLVGLEAEFEGLDRLDGRFLHCFLNSVFAPGYMGWVAAGPHVSQVGVAASAGRRADLRGFLSATSELFQYSGARIVERRSGRIPCGGLVSPWAIPGVLLVGDAAGHVSPATGGGIALAFRLGRRAGNAIASHFLDLGPPPEVTMAKELPHFAAKSAFRRLLDLPIPNVLINNLLMSAPARTFAKSVYFHRRNKTAFTLTDYERWLEHASVNTTRLNEPPNPNPLGASCD